MVNSNPSRRRFLKLGATSAIVVVVAGVGSYLALQPPPQPSVPVATPKPSPATTPVPTPSPAAPKPALEPTLVDKANAEGQVMLYTTADVAWAEKVTSSFMQKYPKIKAEFVRASGAPLIQRYLTEYRAGKHILDTFSGTAEYILPALNEGLVAKYITSEDAAYPPHLKDPEGLWTAQYVGTQVIVYNTELVKGDDIPKTYWDMVKPRFKNKLSMYDPEGSPHMLVIIKKRIIGEARWIEWVTKLNALNPKPVDGTPRNITLLKQGEVDASLFLYTASTTEAMKAGAPIEFVRTPGQVFGQPVFTWLYKYAPHPNAARLMKEFLASKEGAQIVADLGKQVPLRPGVQSKLGADVGTKKTVQGEDVVIVYPITEKELEEVRAEWVKLTKT